MEIKHTPGPWEYSAFEIGSNDRDELYTIWGPGTTPEGSKLIAKGSKSPGIEESKANGKLIACAPEMLEALKENLITIKDLLMAIGPEDEMPIDQDLRVAESPEIIKLKAIIKKAEGGKQ